MTGSHHSVIRPALLLLLCFAAGCGDNIFDIPTQPTPEPQTEVFTGSISVNGAATHNFYAQISGTVSATLSSLAPEDVSQIGVGLGTWNGSACQILIANDRAQLGAVVVGTATSFGDLCVRIYDTGGLTSPVTYELQVTHP